MKRARASILFSATLTPLSYFAAVLGGDDNTRTQALPSPYDPKHLDLVILDPHQHPVPPPGGQSG